MSESWVDAFGFEDRYLVSSNGEVRHKTPRRGAGIRKPHVGKCTGGYARLCLSRKLPDGSFERTNPTMLHRLVWQSFNGPIPAGLVINHKNGVKHDNRIENLEAVTPSQNTKHAYDVLGRVHPQRGSKNKRAILNEEKVAHIRRRIAAGESKEKLAREYGVTRMVIWHIHWRRSWAHVQ